MSCFFFGGLPETVTQKQHLTDPGTYLGRKVALSCWNFLRVTEAQYRPVFEVINQQSDFPITADSHPRHFKSPAFSAFIFIPDQMGIFIFKILIKTEAIRLSYKVLKENFLLDF